MKRKIIFIAMMLAGGGWGLSACSDDDSGHNPVCGNAQCEEGETAEGCPADCGCGNGILNQGEECDGTDLNNNTCRSLGYQGGTLSCTADCKLDVTQCEGESLCGNGVLDSGEDCDGDNLNGETCISQGFNAGSLACTDACHFNTDGCCSNDCDAVGQTQCSGDTIQTCTAGDNGCLMWTATDDCSTQGMTCDMVAGDAQCVAGCQDECDTDGAQRCNSNIVETCSTGQSGCLEWTAGENCDDTSTTCVEDSGTASCTDQGVPGDTCANPIVISSLPYTIDGTDITADFTDDYDWADNPGCDTGYGAYGVDAVFSIQLTSGQTIRIAETGDMDAVLRVFDTCDASAQCLTAVDIGDATSFTAPADGTYYISMEAYSANPGSTDYNLSVVEVLPEADCSDGVDNDYDGDTDCADSDCTGVAPCENPEATCGDGIDNDADGDTDCADSDCTGVAPCENPEATCGDGIDNDGDGDTDCADSDCTGVAPCENPEATCGDGIDNDGDGDTDCADSDCFGQSGCTTETICGDNADNDNDGDTDCDDPDCSVDPACGPYQGVYEFFGSGHPFDMQGVSITFTPDANDPNGYGYSVTDGLTALPVTPGSGTTTTTLNLRDDDSMQVTFTNLAGFNFYGVDYNQMFVDSNGQITFDAGETDWSPTVAEFFEHAAISVWTDLNPSDPNAVGVTVDDFSDKIVVTFQAPRFGESTNNEFQFVLNADGTIQIHILVITSITSSTIVGISNGVGNLPPDQVNFYDLPPESICNDDNDNDLDGLTDCADPDCNGIASCENPETTCDDSIDNDADGDVDCDDSDCYGVGSCPIPPLVINEVIYDNSGSDEMEYVELYTADTTKDYSRFTLTHYNGSDGSLVWSIPLADVTMPNDGYLVVGDTDVANLDLDWNDFGVSSLQNGPDAVVLYFDFGGPNETVVDAFGYEGTASLPAFAYEGTPANNIQFGSWNTSEGRSPDGTDTDDNSVDFPALWWPTPGVANTEANFPSPWIRWTASSQGDQTLPMTIPDNDTNGITLTGTVPSWAGSQIADIRVGLYVRHTYIGDLHVELTSPQGTTVVLHDNSGGSADDINGVYGYDLTAAEDINAFVGENPQGQWTLTLVDNSSGVTGQAAEWVLWFTNP